MGENADNATPEKTMVKDRTASGLSSNWRIILLVGVPIIRIRAQRSYSIDELRKKLAQYLPVGKGLTWIPDRVRDDKVVVRDDKVEVTFKVTDVDLQDIAFAKVADDDSKVCPDCGKEMVLREAKRGPNKGQQFWGCYGYPECKGVLSVEELKG